MGRDIEIDSRKPQFEIGTCASCGLNKIRQENLVICPNCDVKAEQESGIEATTEDPGTDGYIRMVKKDAEGNEYVDWVIDPKTLPSDKDELASLKSQKNPPAVTKPSQVPVKKSIEIMQSNGVDIPQQGGANTILDALRNDIKRIPVETLVDFKRRKKVLDQVDKLEFLITKLKGE
jgi:hypothetical protein